MVCATSQMRLYGLENDDQNSKQHFFFSLCIQIGYAMPACTHIVVPTFDTLLAELMVVHFTFHPFSSSLGKFFNETTTQLSNVEHGLENQSWPASPISRAKFSKESLRNTTCTVAQNMRKKIKTILEIWAEV